MIRHRLGALRIAFLSALALELIATLSVALIAVEIGYSRLLLLAAAAYLLAAMFGVKMRREW